MYMCYTAHAEALSTGRGRRRRGRPYRSLSVRPAGHPQPAPSRSRHGRPWPSHASWAFLLLARLRRLRFQEQEQGQRGGRASPPHGRGHGRPKWFYCPGPVVFGRAGRAGCATNIEAACSERCIKHEAGVCGVGGMCGGVWPLPCTELSPADVPRWRSTAAWLPEFHTRFLCLHAHCPPAGRRLTGPQLRSGAEQLCVPAAFSSATPAPKNKIGRPVGGRSDDGWAGLWAALARRWAGAPPGRSGTN